MCHGCFWDSFGGDCVPRKKRLSTKRIEKVSLSRYHSVNCAQFSARILSFLNWNHSGLVLHFPSLERLEVSEWPAFSFSIPRIMLHYTMVCLSVYLFRAKSLSVPHVSDSDHQELPKMIWRTKDITVTLISGLEGTKWIKFATTTSTGQPTERAISSLLEHFRSSTIN
jgi:hypothetical protein